MTIGLPALITRYEQAAGLHSVERVVVDRGGMAAEFLASSCHFEQLLRFVKCSSCDLAGHFHHPFLLCALDYRGDTSVRS